MKNIVFIVLLLSIATFALGQNSHVGTGSNGWMERGILLKTYTTYPASQNTADTSDWFSTLNGIPIGAYRELALVAVATDSVHANVYILARNSQWPLAQITAATDPLKGILWTSAADSLTTRAQDYGFTATHPFVRTIAVKDGVINNMKGCDQMAIVTSWLTSAVNGHTTGRTLKWYLYGVK